MLINLHVKNIALINEVELDFERGFNVLSGETGAGKSLIIDAVNFALGSRVPKDIVRENADYALSELTFSVKDEVIKKKIRELSVDPEDDQVTLTRRISGGRSISRINGETVPISAVKEIAALLIDIHGQHEHQSLLYKKKHMEILDSYCGEDLLKKLKLLGEEYDVKSRLQKELSGLKDLNRDLDKETAFLEYEINEIKGSSLRISEDEELELKYRKMQNSKRLREAVSSVHRSLGYDGDDTAGAIIGRAVQSLNRVKDLDEELSQSVTLLEDIDGLLNDLNRQIADYEAGLEFSDEEYAAVEERLNIINRLKSKYGDSIEKILEALKEREERLEKLSNIDGYISDLEKKIKDSENVLLKLCGEISEIRKKEALVLSASIEKALKDLNFLEARFEIKTESDVSKITRSGYDDVEFMISTNPGEKIKPLIRVASGGELSRIMLALKSVLAEKDRVETLIFDEIDSGISGRTAQMVSEKLAGLAGTHQVLCITHLPQIAAMADAHFEIQKSIINDHTETGVRRLSRDEIEKELARMLSGAEITESVMASAREMKELADRVKAESK
ncbi:MAG: DNA repair protein RecN [Lachnospiraceae bacterium]|nr:DNA repair protein RecN [Lachnospiraceae bacterium]